jgi:hypothetical protein
MQKILVSVFCLTLLGHVIYAEGYSDELRNQAPEFHGRTSLHPRPRQESGLISKCGSSLYGFEEGLSAMKSKGLDRYSGFCAVDNQLQNAVNQIDDDLPKKLKLLVDLSLEKQDSDARSLSRKLVKNAISSLLAEAKQHLLKEPDASNKSWPSDTLNVLIETIPLFNVGENVTADELKAYSQLLKDVDKKYRNDEAMIKLSKKAQDLLKAK